MCASRTTSKADKVTSKRVSIAKRSSSSPECHQDRSRFCRGALPTGRKFLKLQQQHRAYEELQRTLELRPEDYRAKTRADKCAHPGSQLSPAQEQMDLLLKMRPSDPGVHALASSLLAAQGKIPGAIAETQKTIALAPNRWKLSEPPSLASKGHSARCSRAEFQEGHRAGSKGNAAPSGAGVLLPGSLPIG